MRVNFRASFDFISGQVDRDTFAVHVGLTENVWRHQHVLAGNPSARIDDKAGNPPFLCLLIKGAQRSYIAVGGMNRIALQIAHTV
jgi:hypothetical protein